MTYDYTASALGLGGVLKNPNGTTTYIPSLASVHLAPTGGEGTTEISDYSKDGVSFSNARSSVFGSDSGYGTFTSGSDVVIKNLNLFGRIQATRLQTTITSTRVLAANEIAEANPDNVHFTMNSVIVGLRIDGIDVIPEFDLDLTACLTYEQFTNRIGGTAVGTYAQQFGVTQTELQNVLATNVQPIRGSFVKALQHAPTTQFGPRTGFRLPVKNFGYVHFGEVIVKPGRRRVNLLRIEFDMGLGYTGGAFTQAGAPFTQAGNGGGAATSTTGSMTVLSHDSNGSPSWP